MTQALYENKQAIDVFTQLNIDIASVYNVAKYMRTTIIWDRITNLLRSLDIWKAAAIQVPGRLDIISHQVYSDSRLDWVLLVYNGVQNTEDLIAGTLINCPLKEAIDMVLFSAKRLEGTTARIGFSRL